MLRLSCPSSIRTAEGQAQSKLPKETSEIQTTLFSGFSFVHSLSADAYSRSQWTCVASDCTAPNLQSTTTATSPSTLDSRRTTERSSSGRLLEGCRKDCSTTRNHRRGRRMGNRERAPPPAEHWGRQTATTQHTLLDRVTNLHERLLKIAARERRGVDGFIFGGQMVSDQFTTLADSSF